MSDDLLSMALSAYSKEYVALNELYDELREHLTDAQEAIEECKDCLESARFALNDIKRREWIDAAKRRATRASKMVGASLVDARNLYEAKV